MECFIGADVMAMHTMLINKPPDPGKRPPPPPPKREMVLDPFIPVAPKTTGKRPRPPPPPKRETVLNPFIPVAPKTTGKRRPTSKGGDAT